MIGDSKQPPKSNAGADKVSCTTAFTDASHLVPDVRRKRTLPKTLRFRTRGQFLRAQQAGKRCHTQHLIAYLVLNADTPTRFGVTVSKKVGKAHQRSYIKRLIREAFRHSLLRTSSGFDISLIAKKNLPYPRLSQLIFELNSLMQSVSKLKGQPKKVRGSHTHKRRRRKPKPSTKPKDVTSRKPASSAHKKSRPNTQPLERGHMRSSSPNPRVKD